MRDESFDQAIHNKLKGLGEGLTPQDWEKIALRLEEEALQEDTSYAPVLGGDFDTVIQQKIADYQDEGSPENDWRILSGKMFGSFDSSVEGRLTSYEVPYDPASWEEMVEYMERPFYQTLRDKLYTFSVPFYNSDWKVMRRRLDREIPVDPGQRQPIPWQLYAVAASLAFLIVFLPLLNRSVPEVSAEQLADQPQVESQIQSEKPPVSPIPEADLQAKGVEEKNPSEATQHAYPLQSPNKHLAQKQENSGTQRSAINPIRQKVEPLSPSTWEKGESIVVAHPRELLPIPQGSEIGEGEFSPNQIDLVAKGENPISSERIEPLEIALNQQLINEGELLPVEAVKMEVRRNRFDPEFLVGIHGGSTSSMAELNDKGEPGFLAGLRVEVKFNDQVSFVSGIQYAEKSFSHLFTISETPNNASGSRRVSQVNEGSFSTMELPALVRLRLPSDEKNALYIQSGIVSFFMIDESYRIYDPTSAQNTDVNSPVVDPTELNFTDNKLSFTTYIANLHAAIGYEYRLSERILFQIEPYFQMGLQKMGPSNSTSPAEKNNLYTGGVEASIIYDLGRKDKKSKPRNPKLF